MDYLIWAGIVIALCLGWIFFKRSFPQAGTNQVDQEGRDLAEKAAVFASQMSPAKRQMLVDSMNAGKVLLGKIDEAGNLFYEEGVSGCKEIVPMDNRDRAILIIAQAAIMNNCTLPSGLKTPAAEPGKVWKVWGSRLILVEEHEDSV